MAPGGPGRLGRKSALHAVGYHKPSRATVEYEPNASDGLVRTVASAGRNRGKGRIIRSFGRENKPLPALAAGLRKADARGD